LSKLRKPGHKPGIGSWQLPGEIDIRATYEQGKEAAVALLEQLTMRIQVLENTLAKNSRDRWQAIIERWI
jgi:hypothetical protein